MKLPYKTRLSLASIERVRLPNQWKQWCKENGLRPHVDTTRTNRAGAYAEWLYLKGKGFVWRVNCYSELERGDIHGDFDRWALCQSDSVALPQTKEQFKEAINTLVAAYSDWKK